MDDWKDQLKDLYKSYSTNQKNTKGTPHKFDSHTNFRGKFGVNDTGIPLTPKAAKKKMNNRAGYRYPQHLQIHIIINSKSIRMVLIWCYSTF